jgi:uncharacterized membrane protein YphA (DoxX/SURF4 family)
MLSLFPSLLSWGQLSPFFIRLTLGAVLLYWAYASFKTKNISTWEKVFGYLEGIAGILLVIGLWTQAAALFAGIKLVVCLVGKIRRKQFLTDGVNYYLVLLILAISLLFTGAGFFAFDVPL